jgi:hypothetical protein
MLIVVGDSFSTIETYEGDGSLCMVCTAHHRNFVDKPERVRIQFLSRCMHQLLLSNARQNR